MKDRIPTKILENGALRYGVYDESGNLLRYEYIKPEDDPTDEGTPINKATLLSDLTASLYGLPDPTVNDLLGVLSGAAMIKQVPTQTKRFGVDWTQRAMPVNVAWKSIAYGNGLFVAVAQNVVATSPDGIIWTQRSMPVNAAWSSVAYGNGVFVIVSGGAIAASNVAASSPDGITWTQRSLPASARWSSVTYGNGMFVAVAGSTVAASNIAASSPDGASWTQRTMPVSAYWTSITYGNGMFVAVSEANSAGQYSNVAASSPDGINWTQRSMPLSTARWSSVTYGNGMFVAVTRSDSGGATAVAATSTNGTSWTQRTLPVSANWISIAFGGGIFVVLPNIGASILTSTDGIAWSQRSMPASGDWASSAFGNNTFVAIANGTIAATSADEFAYTPFAATVLGNIIGGFTRIETGEYTGTGTSGIANPNRLTFPFRPKLLIFFGSNAAANLNYGDPYSVILNWGITKVLMTGNGSNFRNEVSYLDNTISWYSSYIIAGAPQYQLNEVGKIYTYIAIG